MSKPKATAAEVKAMREKNPGMGMHDAKQAVEASGLQVKSIFWINPAAVDALKNGKGAVTAGVSTRQVLTHDVPFIEASALKPLIQRLQYIAECQSPERCGTCKTMAQGALANLPPEILKGASNGTD